ncbi:hypothetical protein [Marinomonas sp.]|uniref:hypothetical protein n=1 Tax=Marinomonas sp. TaxID=1904862 RepID=UPI003A93CAD7
MTKHSFLLTYSVKAESTYESDKKKADDVRREIAQITNWNKYSDVETTFTGEFEVPLYVDGSEAIKERCTKVIKTEFSKILRSNSVDDKDVKIYCVLAVNNVDKPFEFSVVYSDIS